MLHILQNDPAVPVGTLLDDCPVPVAVHCLYGGEPLPTVGRNDALMVLGGAMGVNDIGRVPFLLGLKEYIRRTVDSGIPYLGICLGGQLLASAFGAAVIAGRWGERGTLPVKLTDNGLSDPLFAGFSAEFTTFQWHDDSFDLPEGSVLLASSVACPHQAFRVSERAWGVQFHPEVTAAIIRNWCSWRPETAAAADNILADFSRNYEVYAPAARKLRDNFLRVSALI